MRHEDRDALRRDRQSLERFIAWVRQQEGMHTIRVFFTPWGEALVRGWYREAMTALTHMAHVKKAAVQTNLSCRLEWIAKADASRLGLWCTYHPTQTKREAFLEKCRALKAAGVSFSVGVVGMKEHLEEIQLLRAELPADVYLWVNAYKRVEGYYSDGERELLAGIDALFETNNTRHPSLGKDCLTGESVFSVDEAGVMRRCHFIDTPIGNIYQAEWETGLMARACTNKTCGCHIGYVHMQGLGLYGRFGEGVLERAPLGGVGLTVRGG